MVSIRKVHKQTATPFPDWLRSMQLPAATAGKLGELAQKFEVSLAGREMVEILHELHMDDETLQTALLLPMLEQQGWGEEKITEVLGPSVWLLVQGVRRMDAIRALHNNKQARTDEVQIDNLRRMLLAMVEDVRAVVIKLAERICTLREVKDADEETRVLVAKECAGIYAPLANRLGIGQLKWELEDLSFRYLHPKTYKQIAGLLDERREDREQYIEDFVTNLQGQLNEQQIRAEVYGRPKHIYSIWKKMQKKHLGFEQLFDIRAVRIIAERLQDCYGALGIVHANWKHIPREFDDYIATPKPNGYQSIHTVVVGPEGKAVEIQIRTQQMHQDAELGVAAHWKYKEGSPGGRSGYEDKINWLRKILLWQEEMAESGDLVEELRSQVFDDRVYVFTPKGDVVDLPLGSTPLDFAYYIHSNVGHRCIGAKVFGRIVPFTYQLQTGDQVEILTGKQLNPSRDWMNPQLGYVHSNRARAKIHTWFKKQDRDKNLQAGKETLEKELQRSHIPLKEAAQACEKFNLTSLDDLYAAIGGGDVRLYQVVHYLQQLHAPPPELDPRIKKRTKSAAAAKDAVVVEGVGNLLSQLAKCCQPLPGDAIQGFITQGRGVSVHREDCEQLLHLMETHPERAIEVHWASERSGAFESELEVRCADRDGILRDITTVLANDKVGLLGVNSLSNNKDHTARISLKLEVRDLNSLSKVVSRLKQVNGVTEVRRTEY
ncbi:GTP diphosphokinase [Lacimicrobium alkaliphilum]|uniref:GTP pyrophosphokinase n=1 Tax=Lacimicrobium alkaliphilum TaxID=1526571 RepID=A0A0U3B7I8_9ALTE|nr:GTP diphosphokinase [Lacimicrobium alkaliphilum]ALS99529.1 (p)ppGpp synthetase [Lacimicrobium alkaliphilum]